MGGEGAAVDGPEAVAAALEALAADRPGVDAVPLRAAATELRRAAERAEAERRHRASDARRNAAVGAFMASATDAPDDLAVLDHLATQVAEALDATSIVYRVAPGDRTLQLVTVVPRDGGFAAALREATSAHPLAMGEGLHGRVASTGESVFLPLMDADRHAANEATYAEPHRPLAAWRPTGAIVVPIRRRGRVVATAAAARFSDGPVLDEDDRAVMETFAQRAAVVLDGMASREELRVAARRSEIAASFFAGAAGAEREEEVLQALVDHVLDAVRGGVIVYRVEADGRLAIVAAEPPDSLVVRVAREVDARGLRLGEGRAGTVAATGEPYFRPRYTDEELDAYAASLPQDVRELVDGRLPPAAIAVPLRTGRRVTAVLFGSREYDDPAPFEQADFDFVEALATRATVALDAVAVRRAMERDAERERLRSAVLEAARRADDGDEASIFGALVAPLAELGGYAAIHELVDGGRRVVIRAWAAGTPALREAIEPHVHPGPTAADEGLTAAVVERGGVLWVRADDPAIATRVRPAQREGFARHVRGLIAAPLWRGGRIAGIVTVSHVDAAFRGYDAGDAALLDSLAASITIVLDRARSRRQREVAAQELGRTTRTLMAILDSSPLAIVAVDLDGRVTFWSRAAERMYGWRREEALGGLPPHIAGDATAIVAGQLDQVREREDEEILIETTRRTKDGRVLEVVVHLVGLRDEHGALVGLLTAQEDVTERRRLEAELLQAQKMETVGKLAGGVAHDFNNILTAIIGYASLALDETAEPATRDSLRVIQTSAERAASLTQQLLAFSRRQVLKPELVDANDVVTRIEAMLRRLIGEHIELIVSLRANAGSVLVDPGQLDQVILNLAVNARDAMPSGGRLVIGTDVAVFTEASPHVEMSPGEYVVLSVTDTGVGMDEETRTHIFEPFFTTKGVGKGTGLGLSTVYGIVGQSGGHIWVYSEPGRGTTFRIYLPRAAGEALLPPPAELRTDRRSRGVVLLVEDEPLLRQLAARVLAADGLTVHQAATPAEALALVEDLVRLDVVVSDVVMPGLSGPELAQRLRATRPGLPVVLMSGYAEDTADTASVADAFLPKPFTPATLVAAVHRVLPPYDGRERRASTARRQRTSA